MPLFEVETDAHIIITWADNEDAAQVVVNDAYPNDTVTRLTKRPRDTWVISKGALGLTVETDPCGVARDCLSKAAGDKVHAIRLYMHETGADLESRSKGRGIQHGDGLVGQIADKFSNHNAPLRSMYKRGIECKGAIMGIPTTSSESGLLVSATNPGGSARHFRVQVSEDSGGQWRRYASFRRRDQAENCLQTLRRHGLQARLVDCDRRPASA